MRPAAFLDVSMFAVPSAIDTVDGLHKIFDRLEVWAEKCGRQNCINIVVSDDAVEVLEAANSFPAIHNIQALLELHHLNEVFSARDINKRIFKILSRAGSLREVIGVQIDTCDAQCAAAEILKGTSQVLLDSTHKLTCAIGVLVQGDPAIGEILAIVPGFNIEEESMGVFASDIRATMSDGTTRTVTDCEISVPVTESPISFINSLAPAALWRMASDGSELALPIALRAAQKLEVVVDHLPLSYGRKFGIGENFYASLAANQAAGTHKHAGATLDRCSTVVADNTLLFERDFQKKRPIDKAGSRRVHVTKKGAGLRLMFWEEQTGRIEFANIGVKHEEAILNGSPSRAFQAIF
ncbi:hypothetical protein LB572_22820 [Mesorhizobium sp. BH1-1-5]|uniref:hypothetical protein n=1 Tax=Mesorhizobium sp. BH1-1-5 TaxID=2876661 RepID=UPI001CCA3BBF|nr:hypothetical protein [Mesorhizobium sp. BH1-1-5]MBZ9989938.1 hypothetical protein [Mesorhizobium sp. BH1-1-5]